MIRPALNPRIVIWWFAAWLAFLLPPLSGQAQGSGARESVDRQDFDRELWEELTKELDYQDRTPVRRNEPEYRDHSEQEAFWATFFKVLAILAAIAIVGYVLANMLSGQPLFGPRNRRVEGQLSEITLENIEDHLREAEIDSFIQEAIRRQDFALAIRLHYLSVIKALIEGEWIRWKRDKTNGAYLREMGGQPLFQPFQEVTTIFEQVWYGDRAVGRGEFDRLQAIFLHLERTIRSGQRA